MTDEQADQLVTDAIELAQAADLYDAQDQAFLGAKLRRHAFWCLLGLLADDDLTLSGRGHLWVATWAMAEESDHQDTLTQLVFWRLREAGQLPAGGDA